MTRMAGRPGLWLALGAAAFACLPLLLRESHVFLTIDFMIVTLFAASYWLLMGQGGMLSFGHAAYYGLGAYAVAITASRFGLPVGLGMLIAPVVSGLAALAVGWFCVRVTGMYFAMLTLAFGQLIYTVVLGWYGFTGGDDGLPVELPQWMLPSTHYFYLCLGVVALCLWLIWRISGSPFGAALGAIRENRERAAYAGLDVRAMHLKLFVMAGALAGVAGALRAPLQQMAFPSLLNWNQSAEPVLVTLAGGMASFFGPPVGAAIFVFTNFAITKHFDFPLMVFGGLVLAIVLFMRGGVVGAARGWRAAWVARRQPAASVSAMEDAA